MSQSKQIHFQKIFGYTIKLLPLIALGLALAVLYAVSADTFQLMWKGRTFQIFFLWLVALELILSWEKISLKISKQNMPKAALAAIFLFLPLIYVLIEYFFGLNTAISSWAQNAGIAFFDSMPLAIEYLVLGFFFSLTTFLFFGKKGFLGFLLPTLFALLVGTLYTIDNIFPYGSFTPFQLLVPTTANLAALLLRGMGYVTLMGTENNMPTLQVSGPLGTSKFAIAWPCAGIESLLIFTAVAILFLKRMPISWRAKIGSFVFGLGITYLINVFRITTLFTIGMQYGSNSNQVQMFHFGYGPLYAITWIATFPLFILLGQNLWGKINKRKQTAKT